MRIQTTTLYRRSLWWRRRCWRLLMEHFECLHSPEHFNYAAIILINTGSTWLFYFASLHPKPLSDYKRDQRYFYWNRWHRPKRKAVSSVFNLRSINFYGICYENLIRVIKVWDVLIFIVCEQEMRNNQFGLKIYFWWFFDNYDVYSKFLYTSSSKPNRWKNYL